MTDEVNLGRREVHAAEKKEKRNSPEFCSGMNTLTARVLTEEKPVQRGLKLYIGRRESGRPSC